MISSFFLWYFLQIKHFFTVFLTALLPLTNPTSSTYICNDDDVFLLHSFTSPFSSWFLVFSVVIDRNMSVLYSPFKVVDEAQKVNAVTVINLVNVM